MMKTNKSTILYHETSKYGWNLVVDEYNSIMSMSLDSREGDSYFGGFHYFVRWVDYRNKYNSLTDAGKAVYDAYKGIAVKEKSKNKALETLKNF